MNFTKNETILSPLDTQISVEAWITDADYAMTPNRYGEYQLTFTTFQQHDYGRIDEMVKTALRQVDSYSPYVKATAETETRNGDFKCNQLFAPKLNTELNHPEMELLHKQVSLKLHLRDDCTGRIFLQAEYIDIYQEEPSFASEDDWVEPEGYIDF